MTELTVEQENYLICLAGARDLLEDHEATPAQKASAMRVLEVLAGTDNSVFVIEDLQLCLGRGSAELREDPARVFQPDFFLAGMQALFPDWEEFVAELPDDFDPLDPFGLLGASFDELDESDLFEEGDTADTTALELKQLLDWFLEQ